MRKIAALKIDYAYAESPEGLERLDRFYGWLVNKAIDNLLARQDGVDNNSTQKYTKTDERSTRFSDPRRSSGNTKSEEDNHLPDVSSRQAAGSKIWESMADRQEKTNQLVGG